MNKKRHHIGGAMVSVLAPGAIDRELEPRSIQIKDYIKMAFGISPLITKH